jgi:hypothetical protein
MTQVGAVTFMRMTLIGTVYNQLQWKSTINCQYNEWHYTSGIIRVALY